MAGITEIGTEGGQKDPILDFLQKFTLGSMRLKPDKWHRLVMSDEQRNFITNFVEHGVPQVSGNLLLSGNKFISLIIITFHNIFFIRNTNLSTLLKY